MDSRFFFLFFFILVIVRILNGHYSLLHDTLSSYFMDPYLSRSLFTLTILISIFVLEFPLPFSFDFVRIFSGSRICLFDVKEHLIREMTTEIYKNN